MTVNKLLGLLLIGLFLSTSGCSSDNAPDDLISEDTYINLLVELQLTESFRNQYDDTTQAKRLVDSVFTVYGLDYDRFLESHRYYQKNLEAQEQRYQKAIDRLTEMMNQVNPHKIESKSDQRKGAPQVNR